MNTIIKCCRGEKKRYKSNVWIYKKIMIPDFEIPKCPEFEIKNREVVYE